MRQLNEINVLVLGNARVGKTSLMHRVDTTVWRRRQDFSDSYIPTIKVDVFRKKMKASSGEDVEICLTEIGGGVSRSLFSQTYYLNKAAYIIVFDIQDQLSFENVNEYYNKIKVHGNSEVPIILVGAKTDLVVNRAVSQESASEFAELKQMTYFECSAKNNEGIDEIFRHIVNNVTPLPKPNYPELSAESQREDEAIRYRITSQNFRWAASGLIALAAVASLIVAIVSATSTLLLALSASMVSIPVGIGAVLCCAAAVGGLFLAAKVAPEMDMANLAM